MSKKGELKKAIAESERTLEDLEQKRIRSQSAILYAYIIKLRPPKRITRFLISILSLSNLNASIFKASRQNLKT